MVNYGDNRKEEGTSQFVRFRRFVNSIAVGDCFSRMQMLQAVYGDYHGYDKFNTSADTYRNICEKSGYLSKVVDSNGNPKLGRFRVMMHISGECADIKREYARIVDERRGR